MQNHPSKHQPPITEKNHTHDNQAGHPRKRKTLANLLIGSGYKPLAFLGRCVQYFGVGAVVAFLLGAAGVYGYALFRPLPYTKRLIEPPTQPKRVLKGVVRGFDNEPMKNEFYIGVLASQHGPFENAAGSYSLEVPQSSQYQIAVWDRGYQTVKMAEYSEYSAEPDGEGLRLPTVIFPTGLGRLEGNITDQESRPFDGYVSAGDKGSWVRNGRFTLKDIPLGMANVKIMKRPNSPILREENITLDLTGPTPYEAALPGHP